MIALSFDLSLQGSLFGSRDVEVNLTLLLYFHGIDLGIVVDVDGDVQVILIHRHALLFMNFILK